MAFAGTRAEQDGTAEAWPSIANGPFLRVTLNSRFDPIGDFGAQSLAFTLGRQHDKAFEEKHDLGADRLRHHGGVVGVEDQEPSRAGFADVQPAG